MVGAGTVVVAETAAGVAVALPAAAGARTTDQMPIGEAVPPNSRVPVAPGEAMIWSASALNAKPEVGVRACIPDGAVMPGTDSSAYRQTSHEFATVVVTDGASETWAADWENADTAGSAPR